MQASLILKTSDISTTQNAQTATGTNGSWANYKQSTTWRVNLRAVMGGEMWDKNSRFVLQLNSLSYTAADAAPTVLDRQLLVQISGLPWRNCSYRTSTRNAGSTFDLAVINLEANLARSLYFSPNISVAQFEKGHENATITINWLRTIDGAAPGVGTDSLPHAVYMFSIYPAA